MKILILLVVVLASCSVAYSKVFSRREFGRKLKQLGFSENSIPDWVCLAEAESSLNTKAINYDNADGSYDYGIFQINSMYWCRPSSGPNKANGCGLNCDELLSDDIRVAAKCAQHIFKVSKQGFEPWVGWRNKCEGRRLPDLSECL